NGCIINTCIQVAKNPTRVALSVLNTNYTCDLLKESGVFALSVLDQQCTIDSIKHFGFQSGRDLAKIEGIKMP
ncbi:flavin reductase, partial [Coprococcus eutactus]|uniref:flavin reductase n=1 Tax=Coprococcus eutactus TaxID=33043 RepID=UPI00210A0C3A